MNSNLRSMIEDALDGELQDETFSYDSYEDVPSAYGGDEITKLASALNFVATNLDDLGTTDEKLAELELLHEKIANATEAKAATDAAEDTLGAFYKNLKGGSNMSLGDAFGKLSTGRKFAVGGGAGLIGLGALYGGAKMLGGGGDQTNVVKVSSLQDAKQRALVKMAEHYNIPVWELEKIALAPNQGGALSGMGGTKALVEVAEPGEKATADQIQNYKKYQQQLSQRRRTAKMLLGETGGSNLTEGSRKAIQAYAEGGAMDRTTAGNIRADISANPTAGSGVIQSGDRVLTQRQKLDSSGAKLVDDAGNPILARSRDARGKIVPQNYVEAIKTDGTKVKIPAQYRGIKPEKLDAAIASGEITPFTPKEGVDLARERRSISAARQSQITAKRQEAAAQKQTAQADPRTRAKQKEARGLQQQRAAARNRLLGPRGRNEAKTTYNATRAAVDKLMKDGPDALEAAEKSLLEARLGKNYQIVVGNAMAKAEETAEQSARAARSQAGRPRQANVESAATQGRRTGGLGSKAGQAATEAGEKELGFLAKNRRALLGAGALGAAGLAGYGAYRAFGGGGQSKAASYRGRLGGMRKLAEDRINPARIHAGKADPFSGMDIHRPGMSRSASPLEPIGIKAQRIRDQINKDMQGYVSNVGGGYNLNRYLNKFNK